MKYSILRLLLLINSSLSFAETVNVHKSINQIWTNKEGKKIINYDYDNFDFKTLYRIELWNFKRNNFLSDCLIEFIGNYTSGIYSLNCEDNKYSYIASYKIIKNKYLIVCNITNEKSGCEKYF